MYWRWLTRRKGNLNRLGRSGNVRGGREDSFEALKYDLQLCGQGGWRVAMAERKCFMTY